MVFASMLFAINNTFIKTLRVIILVNDLSCYVNSVRLSRRESSMLTCILFVLAPFTLI